MKSDRVLLLDYGECNVPNEVLAVISTILNAGRAVCYQPGFFGEAGSRLDNLAKIASRLDAREIIISGSSATLFDIVSCLAALRQKQGCVETVLIVDNGQAAILRLCGSGILDAQCIPLSRVRELSFGTVSGPQENARFMQQLRKTIGLRNLIGESQAFVSEMRKIVPIAETDANVLITGETGTGKEVFARAVHYLSRRRDKPFIPVDCAAIPADLMENEFFGHEAGAYTNASTRQNGIIRECHGGTLFLDEIECLPLQTQAKLLRFIQDKEFKPLGSACLQKIDVRILAATNAHLGLAVKHRMFREDLYFRLNIIPIALPPLRNRLDDIPLLARHFLAEYSHTCHKQIDGISSEAIAKLMSYRWPGNIRELEHVVERAVIFADGRLIHASDIHFSESTNANYQSLSEAKEHVITEFEKAFIQSLLSANDGNITRAALAAKKERRTFWGLIRKYNIDVAKFRPQNFND